MAKRTRISFDPEDPDIKQAVDQMAKQFNVPPGDVLNLITLVGIEAIHSGQVNLEELITDSDLLRYQNRLDLKGYLGQFKRRRGK